MVTSEQKPFVVPLSRMHINAAVSETFAIIHRGVCPMVLWMCGCRIPCNGLEAIMVEGWLRSCGRQESFGWDISCSGPSWSRLSEAAGFIVDLIGDALEWLSFVEHVFFCPSCPLCSRFFLDGLSY